MTNGNPQPPQLTLSPADGTTIINTDEDVFVQTTITASETVEWEWSLNPIGDAPPQEQIVPTNFVIAPDSEPTSTQLNVSYIDNERLFPLDWIRYKTFDNQIVQVDFWEDVPQPDQSPYIFFMKPNNNNMWQWELEVTASPAGSTTGTTGGTTQSVTATYIIQIFTNYNTNRDILVDEIDKRRIFNASWNKTR